MANRWPLRHRRRRDGSPARTSLLAVIVFLGVAAQAVPAAAAAPTPPVPPAVSAAMQRDLHINADQIRVRRAREVAAPGVEQALRARLGGGFGGAWLSNDGRLNIGVTTGHEESAVRAAGATAQRVAYSEQQLNAAKAALDRHAGAASPFVYEWYVDLPTNRVVITVYPGRTAAAQAFRAIAGVGGGLVRVETRSQQMRPAIDLYGGDPFHWGIGGTCTVGFAVNGGFVTAGHCYESVFFSLQGPNRLLPLGEWVASSFPSVDYGWVKTGLAYTPIPQVDVLGPVMGSGEFVIGTPVCRSGATTGVRCGRIVSKNDTETYKGASGPVYGLTITDACAEPGDSGGPFMAGDQAQGVTSGAWGDCTTGGYTSFQPLKPILAAYGLTLKTA